MIKINPITPDELVKNTITNEIIEAVNECIRQSWNGEFARFEFDHINRKMGVTAGFMLTDLQKEYSAAGWIVLFGSEIGGTPHNANAVHFEPKPKVGQRD